MGAVDVAEIFTTAGEFVALLTKLTWPLNVPAVVGEKVRVAGAAAPAASVNGNVRPVTLKRAEDEENEVMVTLVVPVFVSVTFCRSVLPISTPLKLTEVGETPSNVAGEVADPDKVTDGETFEALLVNDRVPLKLPAVVGENVTVRNTD